ncbi:hypothetical protein M2132_000340 [Dysgonomonas sp. PH5-45]|uniref:DUF4129 domain-containing protein n=1 Tax=unclassified Dysgonomonas TaxID=2630389 RepID=UPI00247446C5|nr:MULTISPECIES: DUF4129 domain-containing protein [unclassified Dysgonomonas]MDH6354020.1 hypothetical protein [Dysgonomonas sp. PH5-45]MDH6386922.1 hypothetical protein [Dysgonomonas sp. PH5-37]
MLKKIFIYVLFAVLTLPAVADTIQSAPVVQEAVQPSSMQLRQTTLRIPQKQVIEEYKKDSDFNYERTPYKKSWWDTFMAWFNSLLGKGMSGLFKMHFFEVGVIVLVIILLVVIVLRITNTNIKAIFGKQKLENDGVEVNSEDVNEMNFPALISTAIAGKNYRLAVRYMYLQCLKQMSDKLIITWNPNKTNRSYQHEIKSDSLRLQFLKTTQVFDYVWYGEQDLSTSDFNTAQAQFNDFNRMIDNEK